jgi:ribosome biogenesis GTPase
LGPVGLRELGWNDVFAGHFAPWAGKPGYEPARVVIEFNYIYRVVTATGELGVTAAGRLKHRASRRAELPAVGDWVVVRTRSGEDGGTIVAVLPRRSRFSRKMAGRVTDEQVVAANVDVVFVVMGLDADYSLRRLERYLLLARESGATPVVLLTKPDLAADLAAQVADVVSVAGDVPVHVLNPRVNEGVERVAGHLGPGRTGALLGSSGVGKSTIINRLVGEDVQRTREVRESDSKGRHTTTHRELVVLPAGGLVIDTPGMRELQLWDADEAVGETFEDIEALAGGCRFADCKHRDEPRCAVKAAVEAGTLAADRLQGYLTLHAELAHLARQQDERLLLERKRQSKVMGKALKQRLKQKGR